MNEFRQPWQSDIEKDGQEQDEGRAEKAAKDAADTADDDHEQDLE